MIQPSKESVRTTISAQLPHNSSFEISGPLVTSSVTNSVSRWISVYGDPLFYGQVIRDDARLALRYMDEPVFAGASVRGSCESP